MWSESKYPLKTAFSGRFLGYSQVFMGFYFSFYVFQEVFNAFRSHISFASFSDRNGFSGGFFFTHDEDIGNLFHLGGTDAFAESFIFIGDHETDVFVREGGGDFGGVIGYLVAYGNNRRLDGRKPYGKRSGVVFYKKTDKALKRAEERAVRSI
jgi:hypothetical protein